MLNGPDIQSLLNQATVKLAGSSSKAIKAELYTVLDEFFDISFSNNSAIFTSQKVLEKDS